MCVLYTGKMVAPGCAIGRRKASGGSAIFWTMLYPAIHVDVTLTRTTYLNIDTDQVPPLMHSSPMTLASFSRIMFPATLQKWFIDKVNVLT